MNITPYPQEDASGYADAVYPFQALPASAAEVQPAAYRHDSTDEMPVMSLRAVLLAAVLLAGALTLIFWLLL